MWSWLNSYSLDSLSKFSTGLLYFTVALGLLTSFAIYLNIQVKQRIDFLQSHEKSLMQKHLDKLSPRHLDNDDKEILKLEFIKLKSTEITIEHPDDVETSVFAQEIKVLMLSSGIIAKRLSIVGGPLPHGIFISASLPESTQMILSKAFDSIGIDTHIDNSLKPHSIYIGIKDDPIMS